MYEHDLWHWWQQGLCVTKEAGKQWLGLWPWTPATILCQVNMLYFLHMLISNWTFIYISLLTLSETFPKTVSPDVSTHNRSNRMFRNQEQECPQCKSVASVSAYTCVCTCTFLSVLICTCGDGCMRVLIPCGCPDSDCSFASLLGLAPEVAKAHTSKVAKPLPQTKYPEKMPISSVPVSHPQNTCRFPVWLFSVDLLDWVQTAHSIWSVWLCLGRNEALRNKVLLQHFVTVCTTWDLVYRSDCQGFSVPYLCCGSTLMMS